MARLYSALIMASFGFAQTPVLTPRIKPQSPTATETVLRVDSALVLIPAHITTAAGTSITTLNKDNFEVVDDDLGQSIAYFAKDDAPVSIAVLFDASGSMRSKMGKASEAAAAFFKTSNTEDEFLLIEFNGRAKLSVPFTTDSDELYRRIARTKPFGQTSLLDAIHLALLQMKRAKNSRKAIVVFSDGGDNWSRHSVREVRNALIESEAQLYAMGIFDPDEMVKATPEERDGPRLLDELAEQSGGRHYPVNNLNDLPAISARIGNELRNEYLLGYYPSNLSRDGKYHRVKVKLMLPEAPPDLRTYHRRGYYAPVQ
ncbi:MAG: VWA domain-containing protein [Acidobacteriota bacterium]|nr:VWA domain-containing protein [Acidobacteriota bacterium]